MSHSSGENVRRAGRGGLAVAVAKIYFILVGFLQQIAFKFILGLDGYGALSTALSTASVTYNPITQASIQGVSREIASTSPEEQPFVFRRLLQLHLLLALFAGGGFFLLASPLASALGAPHIAPALRALSCILFLYGLYTPLVGALNGLRRFLSQAALDVVAATLRTVGLIGGAYFATRVAASSSIDGPQGAAIGFVLAAALVLLAALFTTGIGRRGGNHPSFRSYFSFLVPLLFGQTLLNLLFQADGLLLRRFAAEAAERAGLGFQAADPFVGAYRAAQLFGFLPYQLLMSVTFILFPLLASARAEGDLARVREYVRSGLRLAVLLACLMTSVLFAVPEGLIALVIGQDAALLGAPALRVLSIGLGFLAILGVMTSALNSLGGERGSLGVTACALLLVVSLCFLFARGGELNAELLTRTAIATSLGLLLATLLAGGLLLRRTGGVVSTWTLIRSGFALAVSAGLGTHFARTGVVGTLVTALAVVVLHLLLLILTRELDQADFQKLGTVLRRKSAQKI